MTENKKTIEHYMDGFRCGPGRSNVYFLFAAGDFWKKSDAGDSLGVS